jgi:PAS domain S-box-containing protein
MASPDTPSPDDWKQRLRSTVTEYARTVKQLQEAKDEARAIIETAHDAFVAIDAASVIVEWNRKAEVTFGWSRAEAIGRGLADTILPPQFHDDHFRGIEAYLRSGHGPLLDRRVEVPARHRAGHQLPIEMTIWASTNAQGTRFNAFLHDISERKRQERRTAARYAAATAMIECDEPGAAVARILDEVCMALDWSLGVLWRVDATDSVLQVAGFRAQSEVASAFAERHLEMSMARGVGLPGQVWVQGAPHWIEDFSRSDLPRTADALASGMHGAFAFPVVAGGRTLGVIECFSSRIEPPDEALLAMMGDIGRLLGRYLSR